MSNGCFYHNVFDSSFIGSVCMWERGYGKIVHCTAERDLACRGAKTREQILTLSHMQIFYVTFLTYLVMQQLASKIKTHTMQTKRHFKAWRAIASLATMCSGLLHSWVDSPRDHECVN